MTTPTSRRTARTEPPDTGQRPPPPIRRTRRTARRHPSPRLRHRWRRRRVLAPARRIRRRRHQGRVAHLPRLHPPRGAHRDLAVVRRRRRGRSAAWASTSRPTEVWPWSMTSCATATSSSRTAPPGTMASLGLGYDDLAAINPRIVMASSQLVGSRGPQRALDRLRPDHPDLRRSRGVVGLRRRRSARHEPDHLPRPSRGPPVCARCARRAVGPRPQRRRLPRRGGPGRGRGQHAEREAPRRGARARQRHRYGQPPSRPGPAGPLPLCRRRAVGRDLGA